jgi:hypothetical protein
MQTGIFVTCLQQNPKYLNLFVCMVLQTFSVYLFELVYKHLIIKGFQFETPR